MSQSVKLPWASLCIALTVSAVSYWAWWRAGLPLTAETAVALGARSNWALSLGESWRLISAGFLHSDQAHLLWNLVPSLPIMVLLERRIGALTSLAITLLSLSFGHAIGAIFHGGVTVGFSPALFGLVAAFALTQWRRSPQLARLALVYLTVGLIASLRFAGVDLASHLGGLAAGLAGAAIWMVSGRISGLAALAVIPLIIGLPLPVAPTTVWQLPKQGLVVEISGELSILEHPGRRCVPGRRACLSIRTTTASRRHDLVELDRRCASKLGAMKTDGCLRREGDRLCRIIRRGLYEHELCLQADRAAGLSRFHEMIRSIHLTPPKDQPRGDALLIRALAAHRLGATMLARSAYREAMKKAPMDARLPFLAALLELDFADNPGAAEPLALRAANLDPKHPHGKALLTEIRERLER
jgi:rhomboid protease GluP